MPSFEESLTKLESVVARLEGGELTLEQSVELYEQGVQLSELCKAELDRAEGRVQLLMKTKGGRMEPSDFPSGADSET